MLDEILSNARTQRAVPELHARLGVSKTHGRVSPLYGWVDRLVYPRADPGVSYPSAAGVAKLMAAHCTQRERSSATQGASR